MKTEQIVAKIEALETLVAEQNARILVLEEKVRKSEDRRGPKSDREMTDDDARRIMTGDLATKSHKDAAEELKLSYAQVYSARKGFTFKHIAKELNYKS